MTYDLLSTVECILKHCSLLVYNKAESALIFIENFQGMTNYFLSHLPKRKWNKKCTFPSKFLLSRWGPRSRPNLSRRVWGHGPTWKFWIFNAESCILGISSEGVLFENRLIFLTLFFVVYNQFEIWIWIKLHFC